MEQQARAGVLPRWLHVHAVLAITSERVAKQLGVDTYLVHASGDGAHEARARKRPPGKGVEVCVREACWVALARDVAGLIGS